MFGHDDKHHDGDESHQNDDAQVAPDPPVNQFQDNQGHGDQPVDGIGSNNGMAPDNANPGDGAWQHPGEPIDEDDRPDKINDIIPASSHHNDVPSMPVPPRNLSPDDDEDDAKLPHELIDIKQKALGQLKPLMGQLDQPPEDRFRTLMMMIQASDDQNLIKQAYEAANSIEDEKLKGQALVDLVNEINYFTQHPQIDN